MEQIKEGDGVVTGTGMEVVKGGLILDIGLRGFLPASLVEMRRVRDLQPYVGKEIEAKIIELDKNRNNVVLSRRAWLEQTQSEVRQNFLNTLQKGQIRKGVVSSIVNFGAFVDLGGVAGLGHASDRPVEIPEQVVEVGDEIFVKIIDIDLDRRRISLSLKQANEGAAGETTGEDFDPTLYGMPATYDEQGNYVYPDGFDPESGEWLEGFDAQGEEWERQDAEAAARFEAHPRQAAEARSKAEGNEGGGEAEGASSHTAGSTGAEG